ncbi:hypothetical protein WMY93_005690 [Mugilogobius chulae]|uniref:NAD(P)(+)--arginine ADP-ribosyltransferase n=1 Tax=Mugilogobius chulae TaxID=88201 RepID=A0AAW0PHG8_9GOBI
MVPIVAAKIFYEYDTAPKIQLSMMNSSVDDMYSGCTKKMSQRVENKYFKKELQDKFFSTVWKTAEQCRKKSVKIRPNIDAALTENHLQAICLYTAGGKNKFYEKFNSLVLFNASVYTTTFPYHAVHFWLTTAIQSLKANNKTCHYTYRRTTANFSGKMNQTMRFGSFTSSSFRADLYHFGKETCFYIKTCSAAFLKDYPTLRSAEQEVLIPPYEKFKIVKKAKQAYKELKDCRKIYVLESAGNVSNLNCKLAAK